MNKKEQTNLRFNILTLIVYITGLILIIQLFNLQIIQGADYREESNTRLTRESVITASRGSIKDTTGIELVTNEMGFDLNIYRTLVDSQTLNTSIKDVIKILQKNDDEILNNFPIKIEPFEFTYSNQDTINSWKETNKIENLETVEECFFYFKEKYEIEYDDIEIIRDIIAVRYEIARNGYTSIKSVEIASDISRESALEVMEKNSSLSGMHIDVEPKVDYTSESLLAHVLGTVGLISAEQYKEKSDEYNNNDIIGKDGIQYVFEDYLKGTDGVKQIDMTVDGTITNEYITSEAIAGADVILTIDAKLQQIAEESLENAITELASQSKSNVFDADAGAVVVMNVNSGEVLALASYPTYEPQLFVDGIDQKTYDSYIEGSSLYNRAISGMYPPGSVYKMAVALAGLESDKYTTSTMVNDTGVYPEGGNPVCWHYTTYRRGHGYLNITDAIKHSCNYYFYDIGYNVGIDAIATYASYLGLGQKTGIELLGESSGILATPEVAKTLYNSEWYLGTTLSASIGQTYNSFSPLQMAKYISMIANGGKNVDVTIVKDIILSSGEEISKEEMDEFVNNKLKLNIEQTDDLDVNEDNLQAILDGMKGVTSEVGGTAYSTFGNFEITVGGKTGTAQTGIEGDAHGWFSGFAPYEDPEIAVVVLIEHGGTGGYTAKVAKEIMEQYFGMNLEVETEDTKAISNKQNIR